MTRGEGVLTSALIGLTSAVITLTLVLLGRKFCATLPREPRELVATALLFGVVGMAVVTITAFVIVVAELIGWGLDVHDAASTRRRVSHSRVLHSTHLPFVTSPSRPTEEAAANVLRNAIATRDEALREAARIAHVLDVIQREIDK
jgi:hypothetical protein